MSVKFQGLTDLNLIQGNIETWKTSLTYAFNAGGSIGTLLTIPAAKCLGRKWIFRIYFGRSSASLILAFDSQALPELKLWSWFLGDRIDSI